MDVSSSEACEARDKMGKLLDVTIQRHSTSLESIKRKGNGIEVALELRTVGDAISYLRLSLSSFRLEGFKLMDLSIRREFKDDQFFSGKDLDRYTALEDNAGAIPIGSRHICDYFFDTEPGDEPGLYRSDWDFHGTKGFFLGQEGQGYLYTPEEFCTLIVNDRVPDVKVGLREVCGIGALLANSYPLKIQKGPFHAGGEPGTPTGPAQS